MKITLINAVGKEPMDAKIMEDLAKELEKHGFVVEIGNAMQIPSKTYNEDRDQYDASDSLAAVKPEGALAVTDADLYEAGLNFMYGTANREGSALVSTARLNPEFYGEPANQSLLIKRLVKESMHQIARMMGAKHCENKVDGKSCAASFAENIHQIDDKAEKFCQEHAKLTEAK